MLTNGLLDDSIGALNPLALVALQPNAPTPQMRYSSGRPPDAAAVDPRGGTGAVDR